MKAQGAAQRKEKKESRGALFMLKSGSEAASEPPAKNRGSLAGQTSQRSADKQLRCKRSNTEIVIAVGYSDVQLDNPQEQIEEGDRQFFRTDGTGMNRQLYHHILVRGKGSIQRRIREAATTSPNIPTFASPHSRDGDIFLSKLRCVAPGCDGPRSWGTVTDAVALHCKEHRGQALTSRKSLRATMRGKAVS